MGIIIILKMKFAFVIASVAAIQLTGPAVGDDHPRFCDMGATSKDSNSNGCIETPKYIVPVKSGALANPNPPIGGKSGKALNGAEEAPAPGRAGNAVYIPFPIGQRTQPQPSSL